MAWLAQLSVADIFRFLMIGVLQIALPYGLVSVVPFQFWSRTHDLILTARQLADGSLLVLSMILCFSAAMDLTSPYLSRKQYHLPELVLKHCLLLCALGLFTIWPVVFVMGLYPAAEMSGEDCCTSPIHYPYTPGILSVGYTVFVWGWILSAYNHTRPLRRQVVEGGE